MAVAVMADTQELFLRILRNRPGSARQQKTLIASAVGELDSKAQNTSTERSAESELGVGYFETAVQSAKGKRRRKKAASRAALA